MEELKTITQVTKAFGVSTRMLRYYEQIGLLQSQRMDGYSYRVYSEESCLRLNQIIILRKLRIPLKQIGILLNDSNTAHAIEVFLENIHELDEEIDSLSTIRNILKRFVDELRSKSGVNLKSDLLNDITLLSMISPLSLSKINFKEENTMEDLNKASEQLSKLRDRDVRIVYLPPATVATYQYEGDEPEMHVNQVIDQFVRDNDLIHKKTDLRHFGFNSPCPVDGTEYHGYEMWITVPDDIVIPEPLTKKHFEGGLYAAYMIPFGAFEEWGRLNEWVQNSSLYEYNGNWDSNNMFGWLEEHLNYINHVMLENSEPEGLQLDLLIPIKERNSELSSK
ncbi:MerR family transcriptional regulator [Lachnoclostridium phytofermentans]|uniref:Transcriptional regulator, MerR family n=1 Tax=Lachnoclostridium phytofermentans (strain ATCC 700394 / DSM 18823 / ISDg) TaxID=357809 RepID=A9KQ94_LACP7|nr:effector binding domain-containing protein [Lachnoclostridium phytofermentans]ABX43406.1 transcriptional regulator, MerR family [Lachnoclostridium phytofermentans ISDg]